VSSCHLRVRVGKPFYSCVIVVNILCVVHRRIAMEGDLLRVHSADLHDHVVQEVGECLESALHADLVSAFLTLERENMEPRYDV